MSKTVPGHQKLRPNDASMRPLFQELVNDCDSNVQEDVQYMDRVRRNLAGPMLSVLAWPQSFRVHVEL